MKKVYHICEGFVGITNCTFLKTPWELFLEKDILEIDFSIEVNGQPQLLYGLNIFGKQVGKPVFLSESVLVSSNEDWTQATVTLLDGREDGLEGALIAAIMTHLSTRNSLMFHASLVEVQGRGILFVGPSGIGKTTQAELWQRYRDALIINGDMALVHEENGVFYGHGCPWHGSSPYCENRQAPLAGIVVLEQVQENRIQKLSGVRMIERVMKNVFLPHWYPAGVEAAMETLDRLLTKLPVYLLECRPDSEAVDVVERTLFA